MTMTDDERKAVADALEHIAEIKKLAVQDFGAVATGRNLGVIVTLCANAETALKRTEDITKDFEVVQTGDEEG